MEEIGLGVCLLLRFDDRDGSDTGFLVSHARIKRREEPDSVPVDEDNVVLYFDDPMLFESGAASEDLTAVHVGLLCDELDCWTESVLTLSVELEKSELAFAHMQRRRTEQ